MSSSSLLCCIIIFFIGISQAINSPSSVTTDEKLTVYQLLRQYDFPAGLLPQGVTSYELNADTGDFTVHLDNTCSFNIQGYKLRYKTKITGIISKGSLKNLSGVQVQLLFLWLSIGEVTRDGNNLDFSVGIVSTDFPIDNFDESPKCGCGFDCVNSGLGKKAAESSSGFDWNRLVSSS